MRLLCLLPAILIISGCSTTNHEENAIKNHLINKNPSFKGKIKFTKLQEIDTITSFDSLAHVLTVKANEIIDKKNYSMSKAETIESQYVPRLDSSRAAYIQASKELDSLMKVDANSMDLFARRTLNTLKNFAVENLNNAGKKYDNDSITLMLIRRYSKDSSKILSRVFEANYKIKSREPVSKEFFLNASADSVITSRPLN